jgi:hypothetical protein
VWKVEEAVHEVVSARRDLEQRAAELLQGVRVPRLKRQMRTSTFSAMTFFFYFMDHRESRAAAGPSGR